MFEMTRRVFCSQIGEGDLIRNSALVDILQDASNFHIMSHPVLGQYLEENNCVMFLISRQVDIIRRPAYGEELRIMTRPYELSRLYGFRNTFIYDGAGEPIVKCIAGGAFMNIGTQRPMRIPQEVLDRISIYPKLEMEYLSRKIKLPDRAPDRELELCIRRSDIDMNGHVNNARYLDIADEAVPDSHKAARLRIEYISPMRYGDRVAAQIFDESDRTFVKLSDGGGRACCVVEYRNELPGEAL